MASYDTVYNMIKAQMIETGIRDPERFLVRPSEPPREFGVMVEFFLHPTRDVMCCKVAGNYLEITRKDLEEKNYAPFFDALYEALDGVLDMEPTTIGKMDALMQEPLPDPVALDLILEEEEQRGTGKKVA